MATGKQEVRDSTLEVIGIDSTEKKVQRMQEVRVLTRRQYSAREGETDT